MQKAGSTLLDHQHACAVAVSDEQLWEISARFIAEGLDAGERVLYFEDESLDQVLGRLNDDGVATAAPIRSGQLAIGPQQATRTIMSSLVSVLEQTMLGAIDQSLGMGYPAVRMAGQSQHSVKRIAGVGLPDYDLGIQRVLAQRPAARALCLYDNRRFPVELIDELRALHDHEVSTPAVYDDVLLRVTRPGLYGIRLAGEADHSNRGMIDRLLRSVLDETLRSHSGPETVTIDMASLRFLDVGGACAFIQAAEQFPSTHRLVLSGVRPRVQRALERCDASRATQLDVLARHELDV